jgi:hypothetical protein
MRRVSAAGVAVALTGLVLTAGCTGTRSDLYAPDLAVSKETALAMAPDLAASPALREWQVSVFDDGPARIHPFWSGMGLYGGIWGLTHRVQPDAQTYDAPASPRMKEVLADSLRRLADDPVGWPPPPEGPPGGFVFLAPESSECSEAAVGEREIRAIVIRRGFNAGAYGIRAALQSEDGRCVWSVACVMERTQTAGVYRLARIDASTGEVLSDKTVKVQHHLSGQELEVSHDTAVP